MTTKRLTAAGKAKAVLTDTGEDQGVVEALVSVFGNVDYQGDRVMPGAFAATIAAIAAGTKTLPVVWSHDTQSIDGFLGDVTNLEETGDGLKATMQFDLADPVSAKAYRIVKAGRVNKWSFAYDVIDAEQVDDGVTELKALDVHEVGPTMYGANDQTRTLAAKAGRTISAATAGQINAALTALGDAATNLTTLLASATSDEEPTAAKPDPEKAEDPPGGNADEGTRLSPEEIDALL